jgi:hypothetical protein
MRHPLLLSKTTAVAEIQVLRALKVKSCERLYVGFVCPYACMQQLDNTVMVFHKMFYLLKFVVKLNKLNLVKIGRRKRQQLILYIKTYAHLEGNQPSTYTPEHYFEIIL